MERAWKRHPEPRKHPSQIHHTHTLTHTHTKPKTKTHRSRVRMYVRKGGKIPSMYVTRVELLYALFAREDGLQLLLHEQQAPRGLLAHALALHQPGVFLEGE